MIFMFPLIKIPKSLSAYERGLEFGKASAVQAQHSRITYARLFASCGISWPQACERAQRYVQVIQSLNANLLTEMQGMADGAGLTLADLLALNCRTEILPPSFLSDVTHETHAALATNAAMGLPDWTVEADGKNTLKEVWKEGECTSLCVNALGSADGHAWFSQNWDWMGRQRPALVILQSYDEQGRIFTTLTEGGMLAKIGMSEGGLAIGLNILRSISDGASPGVPVHVVLRHLLSCASVAEARLALAHIQSLKFGAASNIPVADALGEVACFEISPAGWDEVKPVDGCVVHTNHFLCESLSDQQSPMGLALSSTPRLISGLRHAAAVKQGQRIGLEALQNFLRDESDGLWSICRSPDPAMPPEARVESVAGIIMLPHTRSIWIAPHVPKLVAFEKIT
jgi:isopenicillin-N N-acyltransferase-like protein